ncbi:MAG TPA: biotin-dependent carboxyltransferase family protein [Candidatus Acidoferrales bacterium]|nr:biotin-dependent carboxyltransferase family protein [Candidatus Acidoferrales bacterium]
MTSILVESPGLLTTVQDLGRVGFGHIGVSPSGAADPVSLRLGNRLVGNAESAAALEMTLLGGTFVFRGDAIVAVTGSDFATTLDKVALRAGEATRVKRGQVLHCGPTRNGARCYLCVCGGISVPLFLGSASTHLLSGLGGFGGRALRKGDVLQIGQTRATFQKKSVASDMMKHLLPRTVLRVTPGPQADWFPETVQRLLYSSSYRVREQSNRMGLRLNGPPLLLPAERPMITEGVSLGAIQAPSGGLPIILFVDQQTTGGYPKIANVISADLHCVGQLRPHDEVRFEQVTFEKARALLIEQEDLLASPKAIIG